MSIIILIILCIFLALILWVIIYTPQKEGLRIRIRKPKPIRIKLPPRIKFKPLPKPKINIIKTIQAKIQRIKNTKGGVLLKMLPKSMQKKLAKIIPAVNRELKLAEERKRKEQEKKTKLQLAKEADKRKARAYKTIDQLMELVKTYPDSKYDIKSVLEKGIDDFKYGNNIVNDIKTFVEKSLPNKSQLELYIQMLRESMSFSPTYQLAKLRA